MKQKKTIIILGVIILLCVMIGAVGLTLFAQRQDDKYVKTAKENDISRYEWMEMLCEQNGLTEYQNNDPYFKDVNADNAYFPYIQSAAECKVLVNDTEFEGTGYASGRFVVLTALKAIGERKLQIYLDSEQTITDRVYIQMALEHDLVKEEELSQGISRESAEAVLEKISNLYYTEFWVDDYEKVKYQEGVVEIPAGDILNQKGDGSEITVSEEMRSGIFVDSIIVFQPDKTGLKSARRVSEVTEDGTLKLEDNVEYDEVIESLVVSDIIEVTAQDIFDYYGLQETYSVEDMKYTNGDAVTIVPTWEISGEHKDKGFKISLSVEEDEKDNKSYLKVKITNNNTNKAMELPIKQEVAGGSDYQGELDIDQINLACCVVNLEYAELAVDVHSVFSVDVKAEPDPVKLKLADVSLPLVSGAAGIDVQLYLMISAEGEVSLKAELPMNVCVKYDKENGVRKEKVKPEGKGLEMKVDCETDFTLRLEPILKVLSKEIMDVEMDMGAVAKGEADIRPTGMVCLDLSAAFPVLKLSVSGDDKIDTIVGDTFGVSAEWDIIKEEEAPFKKEFHAEIMDGNSQIVEKCTYEEEGEEKLRQEDTAGNTYITKYGDTKFAFDYPDTWIIDAEESEVLSASFKEAVKLKNSRGITFTYWEQLDNYRLGGQGHADSMAIEVTKAADSAIENLMVGKIQMIGGTDLITGEEYTVEDGAVWYAVVPEDYAGIHGYVGIYLVDDLSFLYHSSTYFLLADSPDGEFTEQEEQEIIAILSSFRELQE